MRSKIEKEEEKLNAKASVPKASENCPDQGNKPYTTLLLFNTGSRNPPVSLTRNPAQLESLSTHHPIIILKEDKSSVKIVKTDLFHAPVTFSIQMMWAL